MGRKHDLDFVCFCQYPPVRMIKLCSHKNSSSLWIGLIIPSSVCLSSEGIERPTLSCFINQPPLNLKWLTEKPTLSPPISWAALTFLDDFHKERNQAGSWHEQTFCFVFSNYATFPFSQFSLPASLASSLINNGGIGDRALFCHLTFSPQTQQQTARDASREQITAAIYMKKTSMAASALLNSIIQLSQYYEEKSPLLYTVLVVCTFCHLSDFCDGLFIQRCGFHITHTFTHTVVFLFIYLFHFLCLIIGSRHCVGAWGTIHFSQRTHPHIHAENGCADTHRLTQIVTHTNTRNNRARGVPEPNVISAPSAFHSLVRTPSFLSVYPSPLSFIPSVFFLSPYIKQCVECEVSFRSC